MIPARLKTIYDALMRINKTIQRNEEIATILSNTMNTNVLPNAEIEITTTTGQKFTNKCSDVVINRNTIVISSPIELILVRLDQVVTIKIIRH